MNTLIIKNEQLTKKRAFAALLAILILALVFYGSSLNNEYNLDDEYAYTENENATQGLSNIKAIFTESTFKQANYSYGFRPITTLSFAIENQFFGIDATVSHSINLLLYIISCWLFLLIIIQLFPDKSFTITIATVLLFLALPIHSEIVNNIKSRDELLMLTFSLSATYLWLKSLNGKWWILFTALLALALAILSKKDGLIFLGIIPTAIYFHPKFTWKKLLLSIGLLLSVPVGLRILRKVTKEGEQLRIYGAGENPLFDPTIDVDQVSFSLHSLWFYLKKMLFTTDLISYYGYNMIPINGYDITSIITIIVVLILAIIAVKGLKNRNPIAFGIIIMAGALLPLINWIIPLVGIVAERFATVATLGVSIFVCFGLAELLQKANWIKKPIVVGATLLGIYLVAAFPTIQARNKEWKNKETLFLADVKKAPNSAVMNGLAGKIYFSKIPRLLSDRDKINMGKVAVAHLKTSVNLVADKYLLTDLGSLQFRALLDYSSAIKSYKRAIAIDSTYPDPHFHLGWVYLAKKDTSNSITSFENVLKINPNYIAAYEPLLKQLVGKGNFRKALSINETGLDKNPKKLELVLNQANIYYLQKDAINSLKWLKEYQKLNPNNKEVNKKVVMLEGMVNT
tara:strand:+ start:12925 stop:14808 length:1884 start_codon:yes stop_codon:yes gene_type:complete